MKRPIVFITLFLCLGIITNYYFSNTNSVILTYLGVFLLNLSLCFKFKQKYTFLLYLFFILGYFNSIENINFQSNNPYVIKGYVKEVSLYDSYSSIVIETNEINGIKEKIKINAITNKNINLLDEIIFETKLIKLEKGSYDYIANRSENILYKCFINDFEITGTNKNYIYYTNYISKRLSNIYDEIFPKTQSNIIKALVLGDKSNIDIETKELYIKGGIFHILALSGLHIFIIMSFLILILGLVINDYSKNILVICFLIFYLFLTGNSLSTTRAVIMATCLLLSPLFKRQYDTISSIFFSGFIILMIYPLSLFSIQFILTFLSVLCISVFSVRFEIIFSSIAIKSNNKILNFINSDISFLSTYISISIILNIVLAYYFYYIYPYSIFVNILISIFITPLIIIAFLSGILGLIFLPLGKFIGASAYYILLFFDFICNIFNKLPFSEILVGKPHITTIFIYFSIIYILLYKDNYKKLLISTLIIIYVVLFFVYSNTLAITIINNTTQSVFIKNNDLILLDTKTTSFYNNKHYILSNKKEKISTIVTDDISNTLYFNKNNMLLNVYISKNNPLITELTKENINIIEIENNKVFKVNNTFFLIDVNNVYVQLNNYVFANISNTNNVYNSSFQNNVQNKDGYDILVYELDNIKNINSSLKNFKIYIFNDLIIIR